MPTKTPTPKFRLFNNTPYNRFRLELKTGKTYLHNGEQIPEVELYWLLGQLDAQAEGTTGTNYVDLTSDQVAEVKKSPALQAMLKAGELILTNL